MDWKASDPHFMMNYLGYAYESEKYVYMWEKLISELDDKINNNQITKTQAQLLIEENNREIKGLDACVKSEARAKNYTAVTSRAFGIIKALIWVALYILFLWFMGIGEAFKEEGPLFVIKAIFEDWTAIFGTVLFFVIPIIVLISKFSELKETFSANKMMSSTKEKKKRQTEHENEIAYYQKTLMECNEKDLTFDRNRKFILNQLQKAREIRAKIYSANYLAQPYRGLIPTGTMYGYLASGRCTSVTGHGGIFDTYSNDLLHEKILNEQKLTNAKLDTISMQLNAIEKNQNHILGELVEINNAVATMSSSMDTIKSNQTEMKKTQEKIDQNTAAAAYAARQSAAFESYQAGIAYHNFMRR